MKKTYRMLLAVLLCMCLIVPTAAFAAPGDAVLARSDTDGENRFDDYVQFYFARGEELVLVGGECLYTWKVGEADLTKYEWAEERYNAFYEEGEDADETTSLYFSDLGAYSDGTDIYLIVGRTDYDANGNSTFSGAYQGKVVFGDDGLITLEPVEDGELDWEELVEYYDEESSYAASADQSVWIDGTLYIYAYGSSGMAIYTVSTDGGYSDVLEGTEDVQSLAKYKDGQLLLMCVDYSQDEPDSRFVVYDPETEEMTELCSVHYPNYCMPNGIAYSEENDRIYYCYGGGVIALNPETGETEQVNDVPDIGSNCGVMLDGGYYAVYNYNALFVRNVDPSQQPQVRLKVYNSYAGATEEAYYLFSNTHGDVSVSVSNTYTSDSALIEGMMNQSSEYDVIILSCDREAFNSILSRGYMTDLSGSEQINAFFAKLYPEVAEAFTYNGKPVAVPLEFNGNSFGVNNEALVAVGMTIDEIPTNWYDLLSSLDDIYARTEGTGVTMFYSYYTAEDIKNTLFSQILQDYIVYMNETDPSMGFNTPELRSVLELLDSIDFTAYGYMTNDDMSGESTVLIIGEDSKVLFEEYVSTTIDGFYSNVTPVLLSITADTPSYLPLYVSAAFVNPYSENREAAIAYVDTMLGTLSNAQIATVCDVEIEPERSRYYEEAKENAQEEYDSVQAALETASDEERQSLEEQLVSAQEWLDNVEKYYWDISPESIEWYQSNNDHIAVHGYNVLYGTDSASELSSALSQYAEGEITSSQMLEQFDKKLQMILLEGN